MSRLDVMTGRLHPLLREGETVASLLAPAAVAAEVAMEDATEVRRAHLFDDALTLEEAAGLAALLDFQPEPWQTLPLFRAWVHATRTALFEGAVTRSALEGFARRYTDAYQAATGARIGTGQPALIENPQRRGIARPPGLAIAALGQLAVTTTSLAETPLALLFTGLADGPESCPLVANLTTGRALLWRGRVPPGARLAIRPTAVGGVAAELDGIEATDRLIALTGFTPGESWAPAQVQTPPTPILLNRGANTLWFLPVGLFDADGLDRFLFALPDLATRQGRWDQSSFDAALFDQPAAVQLLGTWVEDEPCSVALDLPAETVLRRTSAPGTAQLDRDRLASALDTGLQRLKAAGVRLTVRPRAFAEVQGASDRLTAVLPLKLHEAGATGAERGGEFGGLWGVTEFDGSTFV